MKSTQLIPCPVTKKAFNKTSVTYSPSLIWGIFDHLSSGGSLDQSQTDELFDFFLSMGILVIAQKYPNDPVKYKDGDGFIANEHQVDEMMEVVMKLYEYFVIDPSRVTNPKYFPTVPNTTKDERRFHAHFKKKGGNLWTDGWRKRQKNTLERRLGEANEFFGEGEKAEEKRTAIYTEAMTDTSNILYMESPSNYTINLQSVCTTKTIYKLLDMKAYSVLNEIFFFQHYSNLINDPNSDTTIKKLKPLISSLLESNIQLDTIFTYINPESQKKKQDYNYIIQGAISLITTAFVRNFMKEEDYLIITLTDGDSSLNIEKIAEVSSIFLKDMIEKDFDIKQEEVSSLAQLVVSQYFNKMDDPFLVPIPETKEYSSFKTMVEMNGPMNVKVPFTTQKDQPFWSDENVLDDKMVQVVDESIKSFINKSDIGKEILKHL